MDKPDLVLLIASEVIIGGLGIYIFYKFMIEPFRKKRLEEERKKLAEQEGTDESQDSQKNN